MEYAAIAEQHIARFIPDLAPTQCDRIRPVLLAYFAPGRAGSGLTWNGCYYSSLAEALGCVLYEDTKSADFLNWNWESIIATEQTMFHANRFLAEQTKPGDRVRWLRLTPRKICRLCQAMENRIFTVADPSDPEKNADTQVWVGKWADISRSGFGPYRRPVGKNLKPVIPLHRGCQCGWVHYIEIGKRL